MPESSLLHRTTSRPRAAGLVGATVLVSIAAIEIARAWVDGTRAPSGTSEVSEVLSGALVALFVASAFALGVRARALAPLCLLTVYALLAHGSSLVLGGQVVGTIFLAVVPVVIALARGTMGRTWTTTAPYPASASAAAPAASRSLSTTLA